MRTNDFLKSGEYAKCVYTSPKVGIFNLHSEGVLCGSYGDPNAPGKDLGQENEWDF